MASAVMVMVTEFERNAAPRPGSGPSNGSAVIVAVVMGRSVVITVIIGAPGYPLANSGRSFSGAPT
jgi:hypothetical protein